MPTIEVEQIDVDDTRLAYVNPELWRELAEKWVSQYLGDNKNTEDSAGLSQDLSLCDDDMERMLALYEANREIWLETMISRAAYMREQEITKIAIEGGFV